METLLGVRFLASEYSTGPVHGGRIDSLGLDENGSPVIVEYKRGTDADLLTELQAEFSQVSDLVEENSLSRQALGRSSTRFRWTDHVAVGGSRPSQPDGSGSERTRRALPAESPQASTPQCP